MSDYTNIIQEINTNIPDNTDQSITALKVRTTLIDMLDAVDDNMTEAIGEISVPTYTSDLTNDSGFITATSLEPYVTKTELSNASYVTQNELNSASYVTESQLQQAGYVTQSALNSMSYATTAFVDDAIADAFEDSDFMTETDVNNLLSTASYITESEIATMGYVTSAQLSSMSYVTNQYLAETLSSATYVTESQLQQAGYVSQSDISNMGYVTGSEIAASGYVTQSALNSMSYVSQNDLQSQLADYVTQSQLNNASYVNTTQLNEAITDINVPTYTSDLTNDSGFITASALNGLATEQYVDTVVSGITVPTKTSDLTNDSGFITASDLNNYDFATESYVVDYVAQHAPTPDLSAYVTKTELSNMSYVTESEISSMGYVTQSELSNASYATTSQVNAKQDTLVSGTNIKTINNESLLGSGNITIQGGGDANVIESISVNGVAQTVVNKNVDITVPTATSDLTNDSGFITSIPAEYITQSELSGMGYLTTIPSEYVTESELSAMSYATTSQVDAKQDTLVSGTNIKTINNNSLLGSGNITISSSGNIIAEVTQAEYDAMEQAGTLDPNTIYVITDAAPTDLSYYVLQSDLENMGYVTSTALSNMSYATTSQLPNMADYVSKTELNSMSYVTQSALNSASYATTTQVNAKQDTLVSGTNIKTINNESLLGSGNITISGEANVIESISVNSTPQTVTNKNVNITVPTNTNQLTNGAGFLSAANFIYDSTNNTLTINI